MNFKKLVQVVNYILSKHEDKLDYRKLMQLLYIADRECLRIYGFSITDDEYRVEDRSRVGSDFKRSPVDRVFGSERSTFTLYKKDLTKIK